MVSADCVIQRSEMYKDGGQIQKIQLLNAIQTNLDIGLNFAFWIVLDRMKNKKKLLQYW